MVYQSPVTFYTYMNTIAHIVQKGTLFLFVLFTVTGLSAQVVINPHPIVGFQFSSKDILNFDVVYSHTENIKVQYEGSLMDANGRLVVQYMSGTHVLKPGANSYNPGNFKIAQTRYVNRTIAEIEKTTKFLPSGDYTFCINIKCVDHREVCERALNIEMDYSACSDAHAEPITPLLLSFPEDEAELDYKRPNFSWIPPMPIGNNPNMSYTYTLVHMFNDQTAEDAIRRNRALYTQNGIRSISLMFPNQLDDLEEGEHYAWQVSAHIGQQHIATSDVWEFEVEEQEEVELFYTVKRKIGLESYDHPINKDMGFVFNERYAQDPTRTWTIRVKIEGQNLWEELNYLGDLGKQLGKQNLVISPLDIQDMKVGDVFLFEISNNKQDKFYLRIKFLEPQAVKNIK